MTVTDLIKQYPLCAKTGHYGYHELYMRIDNKLYPIKRCYSEYNNTLLTNIVIFDTGVISLENKS